MKGKKRSSGIFRKYFTATISIILASFVFIGGALLLLVSKLWMDEKEVLLKENTKNVAEYTELVLQSDVFGLSSDSVRMICGNIMQTSNAIDADVFITNQLGEVVFCRETLDDEFALSHTNCPIHSKYDIPNSVIQHSLYNEYSSTGNLGGSLDAVHFVVCRPVVIANQPVAIVVTTQSVIDGLSPYVAAILRMFITAAVFAFLFTLLMAWLMAYSQTKPLRMMSAAAKQYAVGDFSTRIPEAKKLSLFSKHDEMDELVTAFNSMAQALATTEQSRRSFVANVSHELKTPMTTIGGFIDGILDGTIEAEKQERYLKVVSEEVKRLSRLVTGMLNMSKIEAGELDINPREFDISEMIFQTLLGFEQMIENKNVEIRGLESMQPNKIFADRDMINQVVYNLIENAVKFTPDGGYIEVSSKHDIEKAIIKIRNSGKGIPSEELGKIFERFYKTDKSRSYDIKGAGLGLYIVKTIVELHGGQIIADSVEGEYTEFIFNIPFN